MSPKEAAACYRLYAAYCAEAAKGLQASRKVALLSLAQAWARLANTTEQNDASDPALDPADPEDKGNQKPVS